MFVPLADRLRLATRQLHTEVERKPLMQQLLRGHLPRSVYCALLRDLQSVYVALEAGLARHAAHPQLAPLLDPRLPRAGAIEQDLRSLHGADWAATLAPAAPAQAYATHLQELAEHAPPLLAAHAYVRYLGDLSGGQMLARVVGRSLGLATGVGVAFYDFGGAPRVAELAARFRAGLDRIATSASQAQALEDEACHAFRRHGELFDAHARA